MYCMTCGQAIPDGTPYCRYCGDMTGEALDESRRTGGDRCPQCGAPLSIGQHFCNACGASIDFEVSATCPECGWPMDHDAQYCECCGCALFASPSARGGSKKILRLAAIVAVIAAALVGLFFLGRGLFSGGGITPADAVFYMDGDALYLIQDLKKGDSVLVCEDILRGCKLEDVADEYGDAESVTASELASWAFVDESGKHAYYYTTTEDHDYTLYCAEIANLGKKNYESEKIASDIYPEYVQTLGDHLFYRTLYNTNLYLWHDGESQRVDKDFYYYSTTDTENLLYHTSDGLSMYDIKDDTVIPVFTKGQPYFHWATDNLDTIVVEYEDTLYLLERNGDEYDSTRLANNNGFVLAPSQDGTFYYSTRNDDYDTTALYYYDGRESTHIISVDPDDESLYFYAAGTDPSAVLFEVGDYDLDLYLSVNGSEPERVSTGDIDFIDYTSVGNKCYCYFGNNNDGGRDLRVIHFTSRGLEEVDIISRNDPYPLYSFIDFSSTDADGCLYYLEDYYSDSDYNYYGDLYRYDPSTGESEFLASDVIEYFLCSDDLIAFGKNIEPNYYDEYLATGDLLVFDGGEADRVARDVWLLSGNETEHGMTYIKDVNDHGGTLCYYENGTEYELFEVTGATAPFIFEY